MVGLVTFNVFDQSGTQLLAVHIYTTIPLCDSQRLFAGWASGVRLIDSSYAYRIDSDVYHFVTAPVDSITIPPTLIGQFGETGICLPCMDLSLGFSAIEASVKRIDDYLAAIPELQSRTQLILSAGFRNQLSTAGMSREGRTALVAAAVARPSSADVRQLMGGASWIEVLQRAGVVGEDGWRP